MNRKALLLTGIIATLLISTLSIAYADFAHSFPYTNFNVTSDNAITKTFDQNYTSWQAKITNSLTYNTTTAGDATIRLYRGTWNEIYLSLTMSSGGTLDLWLNPDNTTSYKVCSTTWTKGETFVVTYRDDTLYLGNETDYDGIMDGFLVDDFTIDRVGAYGSVADDTTTAGYTTVQVAAAFTDPSTMNESIMMWMPTIISFAMLSMALGMIKKFGRQTK